jgi:hypothetical protein
MRQMISGLVAAIAVAAAGATPAMACGWGGQAYGSPCAQAYVPTYGYSDCYSRCWPHERLPDPEQQYHHVNRGLQQYYYVNQGPTYTGPGNFAPYPVYQESAVSGWNAYRRRPSARRYEGGPVLRRYY